MQFCGCELSFLFLSLPGMVMEGAAMFTRGSFTWFSLFENNLPKLLRAREKPLGL